MNANTIAAAVALATGKPFSALCSCCLDVVDPREVLVAPRCVGSCARCPYVGDGLLVAQVSLSEARAIDVEVAA